MGRCDQAGVSPYKPTLARLASFGPFLLPACLPAVGSCPMHGAVVLPGVHRPMPAGKCACCRARRFLLGLEVLD